MNVIFLNGKDVEGPMTQAEKQEKKEAGSSWEPPKGAVTEHTLQAGGREISYEATAEWMTLEKDEKPHAAVFYTAYIEKVEGTNARPVTFLFNGGPGAASAYLHVGALGPKKVPFADNGALLPPPTALEDNHESWLAFSDLVFVDPIGTGFSRSLHKGKEGEKGDEEFWEVKRDLESLCEFMSRFLSKYKRWSSPVFIAGESYGGFRVAALARMLQESYGIGLNGALLISPAIELSSLIGSDYNLLYWCDSFPSMAASAHAHGKTAASLQALSLDEFMVKAETFAYTELLPLLAQGAGCPEDKQQAVYQRMSDFLGLSVEDIALVKGRVRIDRFCRLLLREENRICGLYDAAMSGLDAFPDREKHEGPDPTLFAISRVFTAGINAQLREVLDVDTTMDYKLLNMQANVTWKDSTKPHFVSETKGSMDDLRYGMSLNAHMKVMVVHGVFDLVTPYLSSKRLIQQMKLPGEIEENVVFKHYHGGHMFYSWASSREAFFADAEAFYKDALPSK